MELNNIQMDINDPIVLNRYKELIKGMAALMADMHRAGGWMAFEPALAQFIVDSKLPWWEFYEDRDKVRKLMGFALLGEDKYKALSADPDGRNKVNSLIPEFHAASSMLDSLTDKDTAAIIMRNQKDSQHWTDEERAAYIKQIGIVLAGMITNLCDFVSLMVHGRSLCQLVADAKTGDDEAFRLAVQIDRTVLNISYFRQRMAKAQLGAEPFFFQRLAYRLKNPVLNTKRTHLKLWLAFAILDDEKKLDMPVEELWRFCTAVGVYDSPDTDSLRKQRAEYYRSQRTRKDF